MFPCSSTVSQPNWDLPHQQSIQSVTDLATWFERHADERWDAPQVISNLDIALSNMTDAIPLTHILCHFCNKPKHLNDNDELFIEVLNTVYTFVNQRPEDQRDQLLPRAHILDLLPLSFEPLLDAPLRVKMRRGVPFRWMDLEQVQLRWTQRERDSLFYNVVLIHAKHTDAMLALYERLGGTPSLAASGIAASLTSWDEGDLLKSVQGFETIHRLFLKPESRQIAPINYADMLWEMAIRCSQTFQNLRCSQTFQNPGNQALPPLFQIQNDLRAMHLFQTQNDLLAMHFRHTFPQFSYVTFYPTLEKLLQDTVSAFMDSIFPNASVKSYNCWARFMQQSNLLCHLSSTYDVLHPEQHSLLVSTCANALLEGLGERAKEEDSVWFSQGLQGIGTQSDLTCQEFCLKLWVEWGGNPAMVEPMRQDMMQLRRE